MNLWLAFNAEGWRIGLTRDGKLGKAACILCVVQNMRNFFSVSLCVCVCVCCKCPQQQARKKLATLEIHFWASFFHSFSLALFVSLLWLCFAHSAVRKLFAVCVFRLKADFKLCITRAAAAKRESTLGTENVCL